MRCFVISDNIDTLIGMRLAGMEGVVVHSREEALSALGDEVQELKERASQPLLVIIPDRHGTSDMTAAISRYLAETVGIHI